MEDMGLLRGILNNIDSEIDELKYHGNRNSIDDIIEELKSIYSDLESAIDKVESAFKELEEKDIKED